MCNYVIRTTDTTGDVPVNDNGTYVTEIIYDDAYKKAYEEELKRRQQEHLENVRRNTEQPSYSPEVPWQPCMHDSCTSCHGTGVKHDGTMCVHMISCSCPKCSVYC